MSEIGFIYLFNVHTYIQIFFDVVSRKTMYFNISIRMQIIIPENTSRRTCYDRNRRIRVIQPSQLLLFNLVYESKASKYMSEINL